MIIFVTGLHRAGTHSLAKDLSATHGLHWVDEERIRWDSFDAVKLLVDGQFPRWEHSSDGRQVLEGITDHSLDKGFILHCPGLTHRTLDLTKLGKVCWLTRNHLDTITSMRNAGINQMAWDIVKGFRAEFPNDPIWNKLTYDGREDPHYGFVNYLALTIKVKEYFYRTKFKSACERIQIEDQPYYDFPKTLTAKKPLKASELKRAQIALEYYESLCVG